nr:NADH dehydrogenase subunit 6 [Abscondita terminalis]
MTLLLMMITLSILFMLVSHPLSMGMILLTQTLMIAAWTGFMSMYFWYSYILFIVMVGGMLILFIYMTSVASNEKYLYSNLMTIIMIMMFMALIYLKKHQLFILMNSMNYDLMMKNNMTFKKSLNKFIMYPMMIMSLTIIIYLLIALIAVSKITNMKSGPLRKKI